MLQHLKTYLKNLGIYIYTLNIDTKTKSVEHIIATNHFNNF